MPAEEETSEKESSNWISGMGGDQKYMSLGIQAGVSVAFYLGVGLLLDNWLGTLPWLTLVGAAIGIVGMFYLFIRMNRDLNESSDKRRAEQQIEQPD